MSDSLFFLLLAIWLVLASFASSVLFMVFLLVMLNVGLVFWYVFFVLSHFGFFC